MHSSDTPFDSPKHSHLKTHKNVKLATFTIFEFNMQQNLLQFKKQITRVGPHLIECNTHLNTNGIYCCIHTHTLIVYIVLPTSKTISIRFCPISIDLLFGIIQNRVTNAKLQGQSMGRNLRKQSLQHHNPRQHRINDHLNFVLSSPNLQEPMIDLGLED